ncbi:CTD small phosphatase-like protein 2-A [Engystomops pustulosus]|uniref:CTD small phosphatase-like protein 2-A n=1 Tax=Engystomops pustulosus TaxID=76066 RepID=UPI003AFA36E0
MAGLMEFLMRYSQPTIGSFRLDMRGCFRSRMMQTPEGGCLFGPGLNSRQVCQGIMSQTQVLLSMVKDIFCCQLVTQLRIQNHFIDILRADIAMVSNGLPQGSKHEILALDARILAADETNNNIVDLTNWVKIHDRGFYHLNLIFQVHLKLRPYVREFLETVGKIYEIFVFTTAKKEYSEKILEILDPQKKLIRHRLYQDHCICVSGHYVKDLNVLHRDLAKTVALDAVAYTLPFHLTNRIPIRRWSGNQRDKELLTLLPVLEQMTYVEDVRLVISHQFHVEEIIKLP